MRKVKKALRIAAAAVCLLLSVYFLLPLMAGILHLGMLYPAAIFLLTALALLYPAAVRRLFRGKWGKLWKSAAALLGAAVVCVLAVCLVIGTAAADRPAENEEVTVVVLGCQVVGERPSVMLRGRIHAAYDYLIAHPEAKCVATGGMGTGENITEGECIRRELVAMGIANERIFVEDRSVNTQGNLLLSSMIIDENGLPTTVAIASDNFHQFRAARYAERVGLEARALGCASPWYLGPGYWAREVAALVKLYLIGML